MTVKYVRSCGIIPFRIIGKSFKLLLVKNIGGHWEFPKGHMEKNETERQTARREFEEETGLVVKKILRKKYFEQYQYYWQGKKIDKKVTYFLGHAADGKVIVQDGEIVDFCWLTYRAALKKISFIEARNILNEAKKELNHYLTTTGSM